MSAEQIALKITGKCICPKTVNEFTHDLLKKSDCHYCACFDGIVQALKEQREKDAGIAASYADIMNETILMDRRAIDLRKEKKDVCRTIAKAIRGDE